MGAPVANDKVISLSGTLHVGRTLIRTRAISFRRTKVTYHRADGMWGGPY